MRSGHPRETSGRRPPVTITNCLVTELDRVDRPTLGIAAFGSATVASTSVFALGGILGGLGRLSVTGSTIQGPSHRDGQVGISFGFFSSGFVGSSTISGIDAPPPSGCGVRIADNATSDIVIDGASVTFSGNTSNICDLRN